MFIYLMQVDGREETHEDDSHNLLCFEETRTSRFQWNVTQHSTLVRHDGQVPEVFNRHSVQLDLHVGGSVSRRHRDPLELRVLAGAFESHLSFVPSVLISSDIEFGIDKRSWSVIWNTHYSIHLYNKICLIFWAVFVGN